MSLNLPKLARRFAIGPGGVIHIGAHVGQEVVDYQECGWARQVWIEPHPVTFETLRKTLPDAPGIRALRCACGATTGQAELHMFGATDSPSNSLLAGTDAMRDQWPDLKELPETVTVEVVPLDDLLEREGVEPGDHNVLAIDTQGFELECLRGSVRTLPTLDAILCEISTTRFYDGGCLVSEIDGFLRSKGFQRVYTRWTAPGHGDGVYVRPERLPWRARLAHLLRGGYEKQGF